MYLTSSFCCLFQFKNESKDLQHNFKGIDILVNNDEYFLSLEYNPHLTLTFDGKKIETKGTYFFPFISSGSSSERSEGERSETSYWKTSIRFF